jgi:hypothetical protein
LVTLADCVSSTRIFRILKLSFAVENTVKTCNFWSHGKKIGTFSSGVDDDTVYDVVGQG